MSIVNDIFDGVFVINLDRRKDRLDHLQEELSSLNINYNRISAVDGEEDDVPVSDNLTPGEVGCMLSHAKVLELAIENNIQKPLILEDDIIFENKFSEKLESHYEQLPEDWSMWYLGANTSKDPILEKVSENIDRTYKALTTHSYSIKIDKARKLLNMIKDNNFSNPVDNVYISFQREEEVYVSDPNLVIQKEGYSDVREGFRNYDNVLKDL